MLQWRRGEVESASVVYSSDVSTCTTVDTVATSALNLNNLPPRRVQLDCEFTCRRWCQSGVFPVSRFADCYIPFTVLFAWSTLYAASLKKWSRFLSSVRLSFFIDSSRGVQRNSCCDRAWATYIERYFFHWYSKQYASVNVVTVKGWLSCATAIT